MSSRVRYTIVGPPDAPVLVLANSLGTTMAMWESLLPALTERFRVVRFDHRGHDETWSPPFPWDIADFGSDAASVLDDLALRETAFVGVSLGGMVGMWLAAHRPDLVDRLVVVCSSAWLDSPDSWHGRAAIVRASGMERIVDPVVDRWFTPDFAVRNAELVREFKAMLAAMPPAGYAACCDVLARLDLREELGSIKAATLVVSASDDQAIPPSHSRAIADAVPGARFAVVRNAAHLPVVEQPERLGRIIVDHLGAEES